MADATSGSTGGSAAKGGFSIPVWLIVLIIVGLVVWAKRDTDTNATTAGGTPPAVTTVQPAPVAPAVAPQVPGYSTQRSEWSEWGKMWTYLTARPPLFLAVLVVLLVGIWGACKSGNKAPWVTGLLVMAALGYIVMTTMGWTVDDLKSLGSSTASEPSPATVVSGITDKTVAWGSRNADGSLPVGVYSQPIRLSPGCSVKFAIGDAFHVEYSLDGYNWEVYQPGTSPDMFFLRYRLNRPVREVPYRMTC